MKISDLKGDIRVLVEPQNSTPIQQEQEEQQRSFPEKVVGFLGLEKTTQTLSSLIAKGVVSKEQKRFVQTPSGKEIAGATLNLASLLFPYGTVAKGVGVALKSKLGGAALSGAGGGYALDVGQKLETGQERPFEPGLGTALGTALPFTGASISAFKRGKENLAPKIVNTLIKPLQKGFSYGKNPGRTVAQRGITANSFEELTTKINAERKLVAREIEKLSDQLPTHLTTNLLDVVVPFDKAMQKAVASNDQALLNRLTNAKDAITKIFTVQEGKITPVGTVFLDRVNYKNGLKMKRIVGDLTKWTGQRTEDESVNGALTRTYGLIKERLNELATRGSITTAQKLRKLNEQYADLTSAEIATKYRDILQQKHNLVNLPGKIGLAGSIIAAPFTGGVSTILLALTSIGIDKALGSVAFKTRLAKWLAKATPAEKQIIFRAFPVLQRLKFPGDVLYEGVKKAVNEKNVAFGLAGLATQSLPQKFTGTNYDPYDPDQTRKNPDGKGAAGVKIDDSMVATSLKKDGITGNLRLGTVIYIPELKKKFLVADLMNKKFNGMDKIDFATPKSGKKALPQFNKQFTIQVVRKGNGREDLRNFIKSGQWEKLKNTK